MNELTNKNKEIEKLKKVVSAEGKLPLVLIGLKVCTG